MDILTQVGGAESPLRLYPVRIAALDRLLNLGFEESVDKMLVQPLSSICQPGVKTNPFGLIIVS